MKMSGNLLLPAVLALVTAIAIIGVAMLSSVPILQTTTSHTGTSSNISTSTSQGTTTQGGQTGQGVLSVLITDPPNVPSGVTKVYISYSNLQVHVSEAGNQSGWTTLKQAGTIELLGTVNVSQTISSVKVQSGDYNLLRFNISSAEVTFNGKNYTAFIPTAELTVPIIHGIQVNATKPSATIIDISPTVMNIGSHSTPEFIIRSVAKAYPVPDVGVTSEMENDGGRVSLTGKDWWMHIQQQYTANLRLSAATLTAKSFGFTAANSGSNSTTLRLIMISPLVSPIAVGPGEGHVFPELVGSGVYVFLPNGTIIPIQKLIPPTPLNPGEDAQGQDGGTASTAFFGQGGFILASGASHAFTYSGPVQIGFSFHPTALGVIVPGQQYVITVLGDAAIASIVVVAT